MTERNYWKYTTILIIVAILVLSGILYFNPEEIENTEEYDFNGLKINKIMFDNMANQFEPDEDFRLCRMSDNYCVAFNR